MYNAHRELQKSYRFETEFCVQNVIIQEKTSKSFYINSNYRLNIFRTLVIRKVVSGVCSSWFQHIQFQISDN